MSNNLPLEHFYQGRTLNFGHRGASYDAPENTIAAFELAAQYGAHGIEFDVVLTKDKQAVIIHNETLEETTDGLGLVGTKTLEEIKTFDAGQHFSPEFAGERIPTLEEVFEAVGSRLLLNIELKGMSLHNDGKERIVVDLIRRHNLTKRVLVSSFNPVRLTRMRTLAPEIPRGLLKRPEQKITERIFVKAVTWAGGILADHPSEKMILTPEFVAKEHRRKRRVNVWVVNDPERMRILRDLSVDMIMTDRPDVLRAVLQHEFSGIALN